MQWLILPHMVRLAGVVLLFQVADGALPDAFIAPAGMAVVAGATAPLVLRLLRTENISAWGWAIAWNIWGMADLIVGWTDVLTLSPPLLDQMPWLLFPRLFGPILFLLHILCMVLLFHPEARMRHVQEGPYHRSPNTYTKNRTVNKTKEEQ